MTIPWLEAFAGEETFVTVVHRSSNPRRSISNCRALIISTLKADLLVPRNIDVDNAHHCPLLGHLTAFHCAPT